MTRELSARVRRVLEVLNHFDPMGLIGFGAPLDEYEAEAADIAKVLHRDGTITVEQLNHIWWHWFSEPIADSKTAKRLAAALCKIEREERAGAIGTSNV